MATACIVVVIVVAGCLRCCCNTKLLLLIEIGDVELLLLLMPMLLLWVELIFVITGDIAVGIAVCNYILVIITDTIGIDQSKCVQKVYDSSFFVIIKIIRVNIFKLILFYFLMRS